MIYTVVKILVLAIIISLVTEFARRFPTYGGIVAALPLVWSVLIGIVGWLLFLTIQDIFIRFLLKRI